MDISSIGKLIKQKRRSKNLTQDDLAAKLKLNRTTYATKEQKGTFSESELKKLSELLGITKDDLSNMENDENDDIPFLVNTVIKILAMNRVTLRSLAEIEAKVTDRSATSVLADYSNAVRKEIEVVKDELKR